jgi:hypothetical protein
MFSAPYPFLVKEVSMRLFRPNKLAPRRAVLIAAVALAGMASQVPALAANSHNAPTGGSIQPGNLLVATSVFPTVTNITAGVTQLPPECGSTFSPCGTAVTGGAYPQVFNNDTVDGSFGITSKIVLDQITPSGSVVNQIEVPNSSQSGVTSSTDQMVSSFSSKSELALNLSTDGKYVTFMGYDAAVDTLDASNANTPGAIDPTSADVGPFYRVVGQLGADGQFQFTKTNAFTGDNGRAAVLNDEQGANVFYAAGNAGNGGDPEPSQVVTGAGAQLIQPSTQSEVAQNPGAPTPVGSFTIGQLPSTTAKQLAKDKIGKDNNFRGMTVYNNVLYYTKGSGSNGVDTVYFVDPTGTACPNGVGLPVPGAPLPSATLAYDATTGGLMPNNLCILAGFPTALARSATDSSDYPFGLWFANPTTLYVADEGAGDNTYSATSNTYTAAKASTTAGLQKWVFNSTTHTWQLAYTLQSGLNLGVPYSVAGYPTGTNSGPGGTGLPWAPATGGLRNITGRVNPDGTATIWAETSTVSGSGDQGADPNELTAVTDQLGATTLPTSESFQTVVAPSNLTVVRGVSFTPGTGTSNQGNVTCNGLTFTDTTIQGNVTVPSGSSCTLVDVKVEGNVKVEDGASLLDNASQINGNVQANGAAGIDVLGGSIDGNLQVQGTTGVLSAGTTSDANELCAASVQGNVQVQGNGAGSPFDIGGAGCSAPLTVDGNLQVQNNAANVVVGPSEGAGNTAQGNIQVMDNTGGGSLTNNSAGGNCQLQGNAPGIVGTSNSAKGKNSCNATA